MVRRLLRRAEAVAPLRGWLLLGGLYLLSVSYSTIRLRHWGPDSRYYLAWAYRFGGLSERESAQRTYEFLGGFSWFRDYCRTIGSCWPTDIDAGYDPLFHGFTGGLVAPRVLYPLLSAPFVRLVGPPGMLVVPLVAYLGCLVLVVVLASRVIGPRWAVLAGSAMLLPLSMARFAAYAYTEALAMALCMACVVVLPLGRTAVRRDYVVFGAFLVLFAFTKQFQVIVVTGVGLAWLGVAIGRRALRNEWLPFLAVAAGVALVATVLQSAMSRAYSPMDWFLAQSGAGTVDGIPAAVVRVVERLVRAEGWWVTGDYPLGVLVGLAVVGMVFWWRSPLALLTVGMTLGTLVLNVLNTQPSNLRYYANVIPLFAVLATAVVAYLVGGRTPPAFAREASPAVAVPDPQAPVIVA